MIIAVVVSLDFVIFSLKKVSAIDQFFWPRCERLIRFHVSVAGSNPVMAMVA